MGYGTEVVFTEGIVIYGDLIKEIDKVTGYDLDIYKYVRTFSSLNLNKNPSYEGYTFISTNKIKNKVDLCKGYIKTGNDIPCTCSENDIFSQKVSLGCISICKHERGAANQLLMVHGYEYSEEQQMDIIKKAKETIIQTLHENMDDDDELACHFETINQWIEIRIANNLIMVGDILITQNY